MDQTNYLIVNIVQLEQFQILLEQALVKLVFNAHKEPIQIPLDHLFVKIVLLVPILKQREQMVFQLV
jgi:hypothetical protein